MLPVQEVRVIADLVLIKTGSKNDIDNSFAFLAKLLLKHKVRFN